MLLPSTQSTRKPVAKLSLAWLFVSIAFLIATVATVIWGFRRGFDLTDEGFYLLSHANYKEYPASGFAFLGGWLVNHFHLDVVSLRGLRFLLLIASHAVFSAAALRWVLHSFQFLPETRQMVRWSFCFLVGSVAASYQWAPPSLSYNDWATVFALLAAAAVFWLLAGDRPAGKFALLKFVLLGAVIGLSLCGLAFVKWPAAGATLSLLTFAVIAGGNEERRVRSSIFFGVVVGGLAALLLIQTTMIDLRSYLRQSIEATALLARESHPPIILLSRYIRQFLVSISVPWHDLWWAILLFAVFSGSMLRLPRFRRLLGLLVCGLIGVTFLQCATSGFLYGAGATDRSVTVQLGFVWMAGIALLVFRIQESPGNGAKRIGGGIAVQWIPATPVAARIAAIGTWLTLRKKQISGLVLLFSLPWAVAFGTQNPLLLPGAQVTVAWKALLLIAVAALWARPPTRMLGFGIGLLSLVATQAQFLDGYIIHPYRLATDLCAQSVPVRNLPRGKRLLFDAKTADFLATLMSNISAQPVGENPQIMAFYDCPGIVYLVGGYSPGTPWYFSPESVPGYTASILQRWGTLEKPPANTPGPLILLNRELDPRMLEVLHEIGIDFPSAYHEIGAFQFPYGKRVIHLWAPRDLNSNQPQAATTALKHTAALFCSSFRPRVRTNLNE